MASGGPRGCLQPLWGSVGTSGSEPFRKNRFSNFFLEFFRFSDFWAVGVGLLIFDLGPADHRRVPGRCPTLHFLES